MLKEVVMEIKKFENVTNHVVQMEGAEQVKMRMLLGTEDGADNYVMRMFEIASGGHTPLHRHEWEHMIYVLDGRGTLLFKGEEYPLEPGNALVVTAGSLHQFRCGDTPMLRFLCLVPASAQ